MDYTINQLKFCYGDVHKLFVKLSCFIFRKCTL